MLAQVCSPHSTTLDHTLKKTRRMAAKLQVLVVAVLVFASLAANDAKVNMDPCIGVYGASFLELIRDCVGQKNLNYIIPDTVSVLE